MENPLSFDSHIGRLEYLLGMNYIFIPEKIVKSLGGLHSGRLICKLEKGISFQCGLVALGQGNAYISINKTRLKKLGLQIGDSIHVILEKDESEFGMEMAVELNELLNQDPVASKRFHKLKPGMQRYILYYVAQVKSPGLRLERALMLMKNLKQIPEGKESFRAILGK